MFCYFLKLFFLKYKKLFFEVFNELKDVIYWFLSGYLFFFKLISFIVIFGERREEGGGCIGIIFSLDNSFMKDRCM